MTYVFWDIENVSIHNLDRIMERIGKTGGDVEMHVVYSKIKEARKKPLVDRGWALSCTGEISKNSADMKIRDMIDEVLEKREKPAGKIIIISEDRGFYKTAKKIISRGIEVEIICGTKDPAWVKRL